MNSVRRPPGPIFNDYNDFNRLGDQVYYNRSFSDSFFLVTPERLQLAYLVHFAKNDRSQEVLSDPGIERVFQHLLDNNIPYTLQTIVDERGRFYGRYGDSKAYYFTFIEPDGSVPVNAPYLRCGEISFTVPTDYWNGFFFDVMYDYEFDFYQKAILSEEDGLDNSEQRQLRALSDSLKDQTGRVFVIAELR